MGTATTPVRRPRPQSPNRCEHRRAGGETVIDDEDRLAGDVGRGPPPAIERFTPLELDELSRHHVLDERLGHSGLGQESLVEHSHSATRDCAHGELALPRKAELPHNENVERCVEPLSHFTTDDDASTGQGQHEHVRPSAVLLGQPLAEVAAGLGTVAEPPHGLSRKRRHDGLADEVDHLRVAVHEMLEVDALDACLGKSTEPLDDLVGRARHPSLSPLGEHSLRILVAGAENR